MDRDEDSLIATGENDEVSDCEDEYGSCYGSDDDKVGSDHTFRKAVVPIDKGGYVNTINKTESFYCSGVVTPAFDFSEPWETPEHSFPGPHSVNASANCPQKAYQKRTKEGGEWRVLYTLCTDCFKLDRANEKELDGFHASGMSEDQYFQFCRPKHLRREKKLLANKRQLLIANSEASVVESGPSSDSFVTPVKPRKPSTLEASVTPSTSPTAKRYKIAALLNSTALAAKAAKESDSWTEADIRSIKPISFDEALAQSFNPATPSTTFAHAATSTPASASTTLKKPTLAETAPLLINWVNTVRKSLKVSDLKDLCRANALMVSGTKNELLDRVMKCKLHGGPGSCPWCKQSKLEWEYRSQEVTALPVDVKCKHFAYFSGTYCSYQVENLSSGYFLNARTYPQRHVKPLVDTAGGVLGEKNISTGSFFA